MTFDLTPKMSRSVIANLYIKFTLHVTFLVSSYKHTRDEQTDGQQCIPKPPASYCIACDKLEKNTILYNHHSRNITA